jgi:prepilin-type N-terminal cleavage/methylation domain-containing protein
MVKGQLLMRVNLQRGKAVKRKRKGFTLVELLTVLAIITMLIGLLVPSLTTVRRVAKEASQKSQLSAIEVALTTFRNDNGYYPRSDRFSGDPEANIASYCGAQKLAEALLGRDLMGFHPLSNWSATDRTFYPDPANTPLAVFEANLRERKGRYLELATARAFRLGNISHDKPGLFDRLDVLAPDTFVLCDVFGATKVTLVKPDGRAVTVKAGAPILYYRADTSSKRITDGASFDIRIYNVRDNYDLIVLKDEVDEQDHPLRREQPFFEFFYNYIRDLKAPGAWPWPHRPDSYLLITAGADGIYGTGDDICNFRN